LGHVLRHGSLVRTVLERRLRGKREIERNATELATEDKRQGHGLFTTQGAGTGVGKMVTMANENLPVGQNKTAAAAVGELYIAKP